jgi:heptosyltransferase-1
MGKGFTTSGFREREYGLVHSVENHANSSRQSARLRPRKYSPLLLPEPTAAEKARVQALLAEAFGPAPASRLVVLHVGAGNRFRDWGAENLAALASRLVRDAKARVALIGAEGDRAEERAAPRHPESILLLRTVEPDGNARAIRRFYSPPDSGPMHPPPRRRCSSSPGRPILPANSAPWPGAGGGRAPAFARGSTLPHSAA